MMNNQISYTFVLLSNMPQMWACGLRTDSMFYLIPKRHLERFLPYSSDTGKLGGKRLEIVTSRDIQFNPPLHLSTQS
jgi:hypothetical protein